MTTRWLLALATVMMFCAPASAAPLDPPWLWLASDAKPWRLPEKGQQVLIVSRTEALVRTSRGKLMRLSLETGIAEPAVDVVQDHANLEVLVRVGNRIFAFGTDVLRPAAWEIKLSPLAAYEIDLDDPDPTEPSLGRWNAVASADGSRVLVCAPNRYPVVRDIGKRLTSVRVILDASCDEARFLDRDHIAFTNRTMTVEVGITDDSRIEKTFTDPLVYRGPKGRTLTKLGDRYTLRDAKGNVLFDEDDYHFGPMYWTSDGRSVSLRLSELTVRPKLRGLDRIKLPFDATESDIDDRVAVLVSGHQVMLVSLANGAIKRPDGNSRSIHSLAVGGGMVVVNSDRTRAFVGGKQTAVGDMMIRELAIGMVVGPVLTTGWGAITTWDPATGAKQVVHELAGSGTMIAGTAKETAYDDDNVIYRRAAGAAERRWLRAHEDAQLRAIDLAHDTVVWKYKDAIHIAAVDRGRLTSFLAPDRFGGCTEGDAVRVLPDRRFAIEALGIVHVYDDTGGWQATASFDWAIAGWEVAAGGELVMIVNRELVLWNPRTGKTVAVPLDRAADPHSIAVSNDGKEVAIAFDDGALAYTTVERLRARAAPKPMEPVQLPTCAAPPPVAFDALVLDRGE